MYLILAKNKKIEVNLFGFLWNSKEISFIIELNNFQVF